MKKLVTSTFIVLALLTLIIVSVNPILFFTNSAYSDLSFEEKLAVSEYNFHYWSIANNHLDEFEILSIQKHSKDSYHFLVKYDESDGTIWELCRKEECVQQFKNGSTSRYSPLHGNEFSPDDYEKLNDIISRTESNLDLDKIRNAIQSNHQSHLIGPVELGEQVSWFLLFFVILFIIIGMPTLIIGSIIIHKKKKSK